MAYRRTSEKTATPQTSSTRNWSDREVLLLIELWGEDGVQTQLEAIASHVARTIF